MGRRRDLDDFDDLGGLAGTGNHLVAVTGAVTGSSDSSDASLKEFGRLRSSSGILSISFAKSCRMVGVRIRSVAVLRVQTLYLDMMDRKFMV